MGFPIQFVNEEGFGRVRLSVVRHVGLWEPLGLCSLCAFWGALVRVRAGWRSVVQRSLRGLLPSVGRSHRLSERTSEGHIAGVRAAFRMPKSRCPPPDVTSPSLLREAHQGWGGRRRHKGVLTSAARGHDVITPRRPARAPGRSSPAGRRTWHPQLWEVYGK